MNGSLGLAAVVVLTTGRRLNPDRSGCWTVEANTRYRLTVTSARGDYTFKLVTGKTP